MRRYCPRCQEDGIESELKRIKAHVGDSSYDTGPSKKSKKQRLDIHYYCTRCGYEEGRVGKPPV